MAITIEVKVVPGSGRQQWIIDKAGQLKCYLKSPPERGLANEELVTSLAKALRIQKGDVTILAGATGRKKVIKINKAITLPEIFAALGIEVQQSLWGQKKG